MSEDVIKNENRKPESENMKRREALKRIATLAAATVTGATLLNSCIPLPYDDYYDYSDYYYNYYSNYYSNYYYNYYSVYSAYWDAK
jgi:hypothetical protein